ncbi:hypothetical protein JCM24511_08323 [Saitozyma sp. JCM 24511]|nr:hypothetical protein JCM24511_08323 [Saitozyma sp. JCM 24511]
MSFRTLPSLAGPSRPLARRAVAAGIAAPSQCQSRNITFPHPALDPKNGTTRLAIFTGDPIPSMLHTFAIIHAVERKLGPLWAINVPRDPDSNSPMNMIFASLVRPAKLPRALDLEVPLPAGTETQGPEARRLRFGGPGLEDIRAVLQGESSTTPEGQRGTMMQVRVEASRQKERSKERYMKRRQPRTEEEIREDEQILAALKELGGGPYGGFEGLAEKVEKQLSRSAERSRSKSAASADRVEVVEEATEAGEETGTLSAAEPELVTSVEGVRPDEVIVETDAIPSPSESTSTDATPSPSESTSTTNEDAPRPTASEALSNRTPHTDSEARS